MHHMIDRARMLDSQGSRHARILPEIPAESKKCYHARTDPINPIKAII